MNLKKQLEESYEKFDNASSLSILKFEELFEEVRKICPSDEENLSGEEKILLFSLMRKTFYLRLTVYENYINRWNKGLLSPPNDEELKKLRNHQKNLEKGGRINIEFDSIINQHPASANDIEKMRKEAEESKKILDKLLKNDECRRQAEELLRNGRFPPLSDADKQITILKQSIQVLEDKMRDASANDSNIQQYRREIQQLRTQLQEKEKEKEKEKENQQQDKNEFP